MVTTGVINDLMNNRGKKRTLTGGAFALGVGLIIFGNADYIENKWVFFIICIFCRIIIGFGSACISSSSSAIIAFNYPEKMA